MTGLPESVRAASEKSQLPKVKEWFRTSNKYVDASWNIAHQSKHSSLDRMTEGFGTRVYLNSIHDGNQSDLLKTPWRQSGSVVWVGNGQPDDETSLNSMFAELQNFWKKVLGELQVAERTIAVALEPLPG